ncbi:P-type conjugative transfer protein VirB9 [Pseudomonas sp. LPH60]|uniref:P-type conjugative transfer protein VirB9 n=1 Tax=Pseudomonas sp. LPH60 TaxID=3065906 RepID=UPI00273AC7E0|nr:P-type conjugative transfer protein VirB9 [Pseudomonas sp. LPH60]MDP4573445.1 P-type conjugative transfer protein VirB9 [Pseudomonas sp. LPH60]
MKPFVLTLAIMSALATESVLALDVPRGSSYDSRIQYVNFNDGDIVLVRTSVALGARIVFAPGEQIQDIASGFNQGWQFKDSDNVLYIKPKSLKINEAEFVLPEAGKWDTNLMVKTNLRMYDFDVVLLPTDVEKSAVKQKGAAYRVQFIYPQEVVAKSKAKAEKQLIEEKMAAKPAPVNSAYTMQIGDNSSGIAPAEAYDDGRFTYLRFPNNRAFPAAYLVAEDKTESLIPSHIDPAVPDVLVIHRVSPEFALRLGEMVVGVYNEDYDAEGIPPKAGTTVPGMKRVIKSAEVSR